MNLRNWKGVPVPERKTLDGSFARLEPLDSERHVQTLFDAVISPGADERFRYLFEQSPSNMDEFSRWMSEAEVSSDPLFYAVVDKRTGRAEGRQ